MSKTDSLKRKRKKQLAFNYWCFEAPPPSFPLFYRCRSCSAEVNSSEETPVTAHISASTLLTLSLGLPVVCPHSFSSKRRYFVEQTTFFPLCYLTLPCVWAVSEGSFGEDGGYQGASAVVQESVRGIQRCSRQQHEHLFQRWTGLLRSHPQVQTGPHVRVVYF